MNLLDFLIVGFVLAAVIFGFHRGLWLTAFEYAGLVLGVAGGTLLAPIAVARIDTEQVVVRIVVVLIVVTAGALVGSTITHELGAPVRRVAHRLRAIAVMDGLGGVVLTVVVTLGMIWYVGLMLSRGPSEPLAQQIQGSAILRHIDDRVARPPTALASLQEHLSAQVFPHLFVGLDPRLPSRAEPSPESIDTAGVRAAAAATVKIEALGCGGMQLGSGFVVATNRILTNAHVVSGTGSVRILVPGSASPKLGRVLLLDPAGDVAVIVVANLGLAPIPAAAGERGEQVAIVGYPGGGPLKVSAAIISSGMLAQGHDIYEEHAVTREIWVIEGRARPGNSGGPLVDVHGRYVGVVFAESVSASDQAYALTAAEVALVVESAATLTEGATPAPSPAQSPLSVPPARIRVAVPRGSLDAAQRRGVPLASSRIDHSGAARRRRRPSMDAATQEWFDKGLAIRKEVLGAAYVDRALDGATDFDRPFQEFMTAQCWGMTWGREGLTRQQRSMNNLCILAALNRSTEFATHFRAAIGNGVTLTELRETLIQIATYAGTPAGVEAFRIAKTVIADLEAQGITPKP